MGLTLSIPGRGGWRCGRRVASSQVRITPDRQPDVPDLAVVLGVLGFGEGAGGERSRGGQRQQLVGEYLERHEVIAGARHQQDILGDQGRDVVGAVAAPGLQQLGGGGGAHHAAVSMPYLGR